MKLLVVDDHEINRTLLAAQLKAAGHQAVTANNGVEALEVLAREPFDGVISDILMPRMDGYQLCLQVRADPALRHLPVVLLTAAYNSVADRELATSAGADAYVEKPASVRELLARLVVAREAHTERVPTAVAEELTEPVLRQYNQALVRTLEEKSEALARAHEGLLLVQARLSGLVDSAMDAIIAVDDTQKVVLFNPAAGRMFGCDPAAAMGRGIADFMPERHRATHDDHIRSFAGEDLAARPMAARDVWARRADGTEFPIEASISKLMTAQGVLFTAFIRDVTERRRAEQGLLRLNRLHAVLGAINGLVVRAGDRDTLLQEACRVAVEIGGLDKAWIGLARPGGRLQFVAWHGASDDFFDIIRRALDDDHDIGSSAVGRAFAALAPVVVNDIAAGEKIVAREHTLASGSKSLAALPLVRDGRAVGVLVLHAAVVDYFDDEEMALVGRLAQDVSFALDHIDQQARLAYLAHYDALTGLPNRLRFLERLDARLAAAQPDDAPIGIALIDLERFRRVNETFGRDAGDSLLQQVAARLMAANASMARVGVNQFVFTVLDRATVPDIAKSVEEFIAQCFGQDYTLGGLELRLGCRAGVAVFPTDGSDAETLLHNAEAALLRAKKTAATVAFYSPALNSRAAEALGMESRLRLAIEREEFVLHYQPKVRLIDRRICGVEALIRWQDPAQGLVPPMRFIPILEETGLIGAVGQWALRQAMRDHATWKQAGLFPLRVAVNVSPIQLHHPDFVHRIADAVAADGGDALELEITESMIMENLEQNVGMLRAIRDLGVSIAIDDFGTGYSSLAYIAKLPITALKVDRTFVTEMSSSPDGMTMVASIIALAHALNFKVVAEGVETEEQARLLRLLACEEAQGYLFSRPVPAEAIAAMLADAPALPKAR